jgi:alkanesulfonate monooxygenase SsuD/methylene tetrahydromethanopterin reductase-like flavin-dependent oxidoreductase (luciferase family)
MNAFAKVWSAILPLHWFATLDLIAKGRTEIVVGRGSFGEAYPLFSLQTGDPISYLRWTCLDRSSAFETSSLRS